MSSPSYLIRNKYSYCFRLRVPPDLQDVIGKKELRYSLKTGYLGAAKSKSGILAGNIKQLFYALRKGNNGMSELKPEQIQEIINKYIRSELQRLEDIRIVDGSRLIDEVMEVDERLKSEIGDASIDLQEGDYFSASQTVQKILENHNFSIEPNSYEFKSLCRELLKARIKMYKVERKRNVADYSDNEKELFPLRSETNVKIKSAEEGRSELISKLIDPFLEANQNRWNEKSKGDIIASLNLFLEVMGDVPIQAVHRKLMGIYIYNLHKLPPNMRKIKKYRDKTIAELLRMDKEKTLSPLRINKYMQVMSSFMQWAIDYGHYSGDNPATRFKAKDDKDPRYKRAPYTNQELERLFRSEQYIEDTFSRSYMFWTPIIALFHGMRLNEISGLFLDDIKMSDDEGENVWVFDLTERKRKTKSAKRRIPIHPFLLNELNLIAYVDKLREAGETRFFPELAETREGYGKNVGRWFNKTYKQKCGITSDDGRMRDFHSFRASWMTHLGHKKVSDRILKETAGHSLGKDVTSTYIDEFSAKQKLDDIISEVDFHEQIDLTPLKKSKYVIK